jgi:hypothetical protein
MFNRLDRVLIITGRYISLLLALVIIASVWGAMAVLSLLAGFVAVIAMHILTDNTLMTVIAFFAGLTSVGLFFSIYVWRPHMGPAVFGVLEAVTARRPF